MPFLAEKEGLQVTETGDISVIVKPLIHWFQVNVFQPGIFAELPAIAVTYLLAWQIAKRLRQYFEKIIQKEKHPGKFELNPARYSAIVKYVLWLLLLWLCRVLFRRIGMPSEIFILALSVVFALLVYRFAHWYIKSTFWSRIIFSACLLVIVLQLIGLWAPAIQLHDSMSMNLGHIRISILGAAKTALTFFALWSAAHMNYSDRRLIEGVVNFALMAVVVVVTLASAGIHPAALAVTGGAAGFGVGLGLQKIGANVVSGIVLLIRKPVNQGDVILMEKGFGSISRFGLIKDLGLLYVHVFTRDGTEEFIPNEIFVTQKIVNASRRTGPLRLRIPFGISYASDLHQAMALAGEAAKNVDRVLTTPEPACRFIELGDSTVNLELRVWINDPQHGVTNAKSSVLLAVWDIFHANDIEFAFPQRDLHIKDAVPLKIYKDHTQPVAKDSLGVTGNKGGTD
ncbi:MAG: mechanosensitive ion channel [Deltaproteobacteria bacterium]|nr:mechanosensitive ion channel [Deltaproteobacteria bacterium]